jgi:WD40 repeat protein
MLSGHKDIVTALALSHDGNALYSASQDNTIGIWNLKTRQFIRVPSGLGETDYSIRNLAPTPDGNYLFGANNYNRAIVLDLERVSSHLFNEGDSK